MLFAAVIGLPAGAIAAVKRGTWFDQVLMGLSVTGYSMPIFWWGLLLIMFVGERWGLTPVSGRIDLINYYFEPRTGFMVIDAWLSGQAGAVKDALRHLILPAVVLGTIPLAVIARQTRSAMLEVLGEDYVRTARAKGLSERQVRLRHVLRNSMIPIVTLFGLDFGMVVGGGAILTESVYNLDGVGLYAGGAIRSLDLPPLMAVTMFGAFFIVLFNTLVDLAYAGLDPRIRLGEAAPV
jgi:dipeptide transport system permease protein